MLGRPEAGLGLSGPALRAGIHLPPVTTVGLLRPPRRRKGGCPWPSRASALSRWRGSLGHGSLGPTTRELADSSGLWGGKLQGSRGVREAQTMRQTPLLHQVLELPGLAVQDAAPFITVRVPGRSGDCPGCRGGGEGAKKGPTRAPPFARCAFQEVGLKVEDGPATRLQGAGDERQVWALA